MRSKGRSSGKGCAKTTSPSFFCFLKEREREGEGERERERKTGTERREGAERRERENLHLGVELNAQLDFMSIL